MVRKRESKLERAVWCSKCRSRVKETCWEEHPSEVTWKNIPRRKKNKIFGGVTVEKSKEAEKS